MDGVPYPQPLAGPEPQYVPWGVLLVRPIGHPPRPVPPRAADQQSRAYPTLLRVLRWGRYGHRGGGQTPEVGSLACVSRGPFSSRPPFRCVVCGGGFPVSPGWGGGGWGGGISLFLAVLLVCVSPPPLVVVRRRCVCVCGAVRARVVSVLPCGVWFVVCGVRRWCVGGVVAGVWCGWSLATPGGGSCVLLPATPGWVSLPVVECGSPPLLAGVSLSAVVCGVWCVVCGVWCAAVVCWWICGWCVVWLIPRHSWRRFLCATPRHSLLRFAAGGGGRSSPLLAEGPGRGSPPLLGGVRWRRWCVVGLWLVCGVVGPSPLLAVVPVCYSPPLLAGFRCRWWCAVPRHSWLGSAGGGGAWCVVCGVWCVVCGGGVLVGLWLVCGVVGPSPLLAEVPVCYSPPLLAGFRCRWWWGVLATPGWGPLAAVVCGGVVAGVCIMCLALGLCRRCVLEGGRHMHMFGMLPISPNQATGAPAAP